MSPDGAGSQRIVVIGGGGGPRRTAPPPDMDPPAAPPVGRQPLQQRGWTTRRLAIACGLGAAAIVVGGVVFVAKFRVLGGNDSPFLAMGFGLFVIGMVVFCASLIALIGTGVSIIAERHGWARGAGIILGPLALAWLLYFAGVFAYAVPAVLSLVLIGGLVVALK